MEADCTCAKRTHYLMDKTMQGFFLVDLSQLNRLNTQLRIANGDHTESIVFVAHKHRTKPKKQQF